MSIIDEIISLSRELGREDRKMAILGEGNTSCKDCRDKTFLVKASGSSLSTMSERRCDRNAGLNRCLKLLDEARREMTKQILSVLQASQVDLKAKRPSTEAVFHAYLLSLRGMGGLGTRIDRGEWAALFAAGAGLCDASVLPGRDCLLRADQRAAAVCLILDWHWRGDSNRG